MRRSAQAQSAEEQSSERESAPAADPAAGGTKQSGARHLRRVQSFPVGHGQFMFDGPARSAALRAVRDAQEWGAAALSPPDVSES